MLSVIYVILNSNAMMTLQLFRRVKLSIRLCT